MLLILLALQAASPVARPPAPAAAKGLGATANTVDLPIARPKGRATFVDEFDGSRVDPAKWHFDVARNAVGWPNHEAQYYGPDNARVADGSLVIEARHEAPRAADSGGQHYTSAKLVSRPALGYGFYEVRAKLPCGRGTWPAIWLLPSTGKWPDAGEIDIMEMVGWNPDVVHATVHSAAYNHVKGTQRGAQIAVPTACSAYHRYQLDWRPDAILIGMDDRAYMRVANDRPGDRAAWPFDRPYQLILNLAIGGDWGGSKGIDDAALPQDMRVDYVRYWARS